MFKNRKSFAVLCAVSLAVFLLLWRVTTLSPWSERGVNLPYGWRGLEGGLVPTACTVLVDDLVGDAPGNLVHPLGFPLQTVRPGPDGGCYTDTNDLAEVINLLSLAVVSCLIGVAGMKVVSKSKVEADS